MEPILEELDHAVEALEEAESLASAKMGTRLMVTEQLNRTRRLRDRVRRIVEDEQA